MFAHVGVVRNLKSVMENKKQLTLTIIKQDSKILLGMKKRGFGQGRWNGFGGKIEEGETIEQAAAREVQEEAGLKIKNLNKKGILEFEYKSDPKILEVHIFDSSDFEGEPLETEEMNPRWFHVDKIPFDDMWPDDIHWMPYLLVQKKFRGKFLFDRPSDANYSSKILFMDLQEAVEL